MRNVLKKIKNRLIFYLNKNKKFKNEEAFYTYFFTKNPSWSSPEPNEDETIRWNEIKNNLSILFSDNSFNISGFFAL